MRNMQKTGCLRCPLAACLYKLELWLTRRQFKNAQAKEAAEEAVAGPIVAASFGALP